jgi:hypothetical protein
VQDDAAPPPIGEGYREGRPELVAYLLTALTYIGLGIALTSIVLNWIVGPTLIVALVLAFTPLCRRVQSWRVSRR